jgi:hypothetical protein
MKIKVPLMFCFSLLAGLTMCHARVQAQSKPEPYSKKKPPPVFAILPDLVIRSAKKSSKSRAWFRHTTDAAHGPRLPTAGKCNDYSGCVALNGKARLAP